MNSNSSSSYLLLLLVTTILLGTYNEGFANQSYFPRNRIVFDGERDLFEGNFDALERNKVLNQCQNSYRRSMEEMEMTLRELLPNLKIVKDFTKKINNQLKTFLDKRNVKLEKIYQCYSNESGCVNNEDISQVLKDGNLRERMGLLYHTRDHLYKIYKDEGYHKIIRPLKDLNMTRRCNLRVMNSSNQKLLCMLRNSSLHKNSKEHIQKLSERELKKIYRGEAQRLYESTSHPLKEEWKDYQSFLKALSLEEKDIMPVMGGRCWYSGRGCFEGNNDFCFSDICGYEGGNPCTEKEQQECRHYRSMIKNKMLPEKTGPSGTGIFMLEYQQMLGANSEKDLYEGRLANMAWMLSDHDHSSHEVLFTSKGYNLYYDSGPNFYKSLLGYNTEASAKLSEQIEKHHKDNGRVLPYEVIDNCIGDSLKTVKRCGRLRVIPYEEVQIDNLNNFFSAIRNMDSSKNLNEKNTMDEEKGRKEKILEKMATTLDKDLVTYSWMSKEACLDLQQRGSVYYEDNSETYASLTAAGAGRYVSLNLHDNLYFSDGGNILCEITIKKGQKYLNLRDSKKHSEMTNNGITEEDVASMSPNIAFMYPHFNRAADLEWVNIKLKNPNSISARVIDDKNYNTVNINHVKSAISMQRMLSVPGEGINLLKNIEKNYKQAKLYHLAENEYYRESLSKCVQKRDGKIHEVESKFCPLTFHALLMRGDVRCGVYFNNEFIEFTTINYCSEAEIQREKLKLSNRVGNVNIITKAMSPFGQMTDQELLTNLYLKKGNKNYIILPSGQSGVYKVEEVSSPAEGLTKLKDVGQTLKFSSYLNEMNEKEKMTRAHLQRALHKYGQTLYTVPNSIPTLDMYKEILVQDALNSPDKTSSYGTGIEKAVIPIYELNVLKKLTTKDEIYNEYRKLRDMIWNGGVCSPMVNEYKDRYWKSTNIDSFKMFYVVCGHKKYAIRMKTL